jgi:hypothetical protein
MPLPRGPRRAAVPDGHPQRAAVAQTGSQQLARGVRWARRGRGRLGASELGGRAGELFAAARGGVRGL